MKFWDSSAVVPLLVDEADQKHTRGRLEQDPVMLVWWGTPIECVSALARRERDGSLDSDGIRIALARLRVLSEQWHEVLPTVTLRSVAERMLRVHPLRAGNALQLAAALVAAERDPPSLEFVSLDERLQDAASKEGFRVV